MTLKILEFYSGLGGMHFASRLADWDVQVLKAFDINDVANNVYKHNFGTKAVGQHMIEGLNLNDFENWHADVWTMSPPCQPYTRTGLQQASCDPRSKSFLYLLNILDKMKNSPTYIFVENVKGFETSDSRDMLVRQLEKSGYYFQEYLLNPNTTLGIPNSRLRYYMLARRHDPFVDQGRVLETLTLDRTMVGFPPLIQDYLELDADFQSYRVPDKILLKMGPVFDIVKPSSDHSCCFTKGYFHYAQGTGSILQLNEEANTQSVFDEIEQAKQAGNVDRQLELYHLLRLRYFTPREVANLMGFPVEFGFPETTSIKQRYRTLGNSINVALVAQLMRLLVAS